MSEVKIKVVPTSGEPSERTVEITPTGASLGDVLRQAGIKSDTSNVLVDGEPANAKTHVAAGATVQVTERVSGS